MNKIDKKWIALLRTSPLMDEQWYSRVYRLTDSEDAVIHYLETGWKLLYDPSASFSTVGYLRDNPDVAQAELPPLVHYEAYGRIEGRAIRPSESAGACLWKGKSQTGISRAVYAPQSTLKPRPPLEKWLEQVKSHDYLSFDIFDTLILRDVDLPSDVFRIMGVILEEPQFATIRQEAEQECYRTVGVNCNIRDIYCRVSETFAISPEQGMALELGCEKRICKANPFMQALYYAALKENIPVVLVSDMYWPAEQMEEILKACGYRDWNGLYVSCDRCANKASGLLQKAVWNDIGTEKSVLHIGDNLQADVEASVAMGWDSLHYVSCKDKVPYLYNPTTKSLPSSMASAICTNKLNNGIQRYTKEYEHGFLYGGILAYGFCQWVEEFSSLHEADRIWFLARDMDIIRKVYQQNFQKINSSYVHVSRSAVMELNVEENPESFFHYQFYNHACSGQLRLDKVLHEVRLERLTKYLWNYGLKPETHLSLENYPTLHRLYLDHVDEVIAAFAPSVVAAEKYFSRHLEHTRRLCIVDLGWNGTIMVELKKFLRRKNFSLDAIYCVMLGGNNTPQTNDMISSEMLHTYLFSGIHNTNLSIPADTLSGNTQIMCLEAMFSADQPTLLHYELDENEQPVLINGAFTALPWQIGEIQTGILDFAKEYAELAKELNCQLKIYPIDAFAPYQSVIDDFQYLYLLFESVKEYDDGTAVAGGDQNRLTTIGNIMQARGLI